MLAAFALCATLLRSEGTALDGETALFGVNYYAPFSVDYDGLKAKGLDVKVVSIPMTYSGRYVAENTNLDGICKLVINKKTNTLIGAHIIGSYAGEFIVAVSAMVDLEVDIENVKKLVFPHPTVCEIVREAIFTI